MEFTALKAGKFAAAIMDWCFNNSRKKRQLAPPPEVLYMRPSPEKCCCHFAIYPAGCTPIQSVLFIISLYCGCTYVCIVCVCVVTYTYSYERLSFCYVCIMQQKCVGE